MKFKSLSPVPALSRFTSPLNKIGRWAFALALLSIPLQLNSFVYGAEWGRGFLNPYTSIFFSLTDLLLLISGVLFFIDRKIQKRKIKEGQPVYFFLLVLSLSLGVYSAYLNSNGTENLHYFLFIKLLELFLFYILIVNKVLSVQEVLRVFVYTLSFEAALGLFQVVFQTGVGLQILGEPMLSSLNPHLARFSFQSLDIIRAYGTFPHPNILGGFLALSILSTFLIKPLYKYEWPLLFSVQFLGLFASFSRSAILSLSIALALLGFWYLRTLKEKKNKTLTIILSGLFLVELLSLLFMRGIHFLSDPNFIERWEGYKMAFKLFLSHPLGLGFSNFTMSMDTFSGQTLMPWEYQPVHNIFLLALVEIGIFGFLFALGLLGFCLYSLFKRRKTFLNRKKQLRRQVFFAILLVLMILGSFDHYLLSLDQGRYLILLFFALSSLFSSEALPVYAIRKEGMLSKTPLVRS